MADGVMLGRLIADAYSKGWSIARVAAELSVGRGLVYCALKTMGVPRRSTATKGLRCVDCGKQCYPARRCDYHRKIRNAEMNLEQKREKTIGAMCRIEGAPPCDSDVREFLRGNYDLPKLDEKDTTR